MSSILDLASWALQVLSKGLIHNVLARLRVLDPNPPPSNL